MGKIQNKTMSNSRKIRLIIKIITKLNQKKKKIIIIHNNNKKMEIKRNKMIRNNKLVNKIRIILKKRKT